MGMDFEYVKEIGYDEWGQRSYIEYGNNKNQSGTASGEGVKTYYTYDENRRWLKEIKTLKEGREYQKIEYTFDKVGNVEKYENKAGRYETNQKYEYDDLYQLTGATGDSIQRLYDSGSIEDYRADYKQTFEYDIIGNMTKKTSRESKTQQVKNGMSLNYEFDYQYYGNSHKAERIGDMYYRYDGNGNVVEERYGGHSSPDTGSVAYNYDDGLYSADYGFALTRPGSGSKENGGVYERRYTWDYRNQLLKTKDNKWTVNYRYGYDGQRTVKYTEETRNETLYFNSMWQASTSGSGHEWLQSKHIFVGESRIATKSNKEIDGKTEGSLSFENEHQYWYHSDHLGSAQLTTTRSGELHERIEYTPYGEIWIEHKYNLAEGSLPYRFTGKELDEETGYYYYGARYLDPRTSRWISTDPAMGDYIPSAPVDDEAKKRNGNLPGIGGVFNVVNMHVYHYAGNNPVKLIDPNGRTIETIEIYKQKDSPYSGWFMSGVVTYDYYNSSTSNKKNTIGNYGCKFMAAASIGRALTNSPINIENYNTTAYYENPVANGNIGGVNVNMKDTQFVDLVRDMSGANLNYEVFTAANGSFSDKLKELNESSTQYYVTAQFKKTSVIPDSHFSVLDGITVDADGKVSISYTEQANGIPDNAFNVNDITKLIIIWRCPDE